MTIFSRIIYRSITVLLGTVMLLSCKNDITKVNVVTERVEKPAMSGENLEMIYSDSARIQYKVITPVYLKISEQNRKYDEFPKGIYVISYDRNGNIIASIRAKYAKKLEDEMLWEGRNEVVVMNADGKKLETELLWWDMKNERIWSDRYVRLTADGQVIEGNNGFESDQNLENPVFKNITGQVEVQKEP